MATVQAFIRTSVKKADKVNIRFRLRDGRAVQLFHTSEIEINPEVWDNDKQMIKARITYNEEERQRFNSSVIKRKDVVLKAYSKLEDSEINSHRLEEEIDKLLNPNKYRLESDIPTTLLKYIERFIKLSPQRKDKATGRLLTRNNIRQYGGTYNHLKAFADNQGRNDYEFADVNQKFYKEFVSYLQSRIIKRDILGLPVLDEEGNEIEVKKSFTANSVGKHIKILKLVLNEAKVDGVNISTSYEAFHVLSEETDTVYLGEEELKLLKKLDLHEKPHLDRVRDWFLLLAWTGCRFSDLENITKADIKNDFITFRQQKTNTKVTIPLHPVAKEILTKYEFNLPDPISNQKFNEYIKEVAKLAKIEDREAITRTVGGKLQTEHFPKYQLISSHTGRRSFCTNMYKRGLPTLMIMSVSGHKTEKSFLKYIKVKQEEHAEMMLNKWKEIYK